jgi:hypothetical protein
MRYTVVWRETALQQLAQIWLASADRNAITQAAATVDRELTNDPETKGDDYYGDRTLVLSPVMWVLFTVRADDRIADVLQVGRPGLDLPHEPAG